MMNTSSLSGKRIVVTRAAEQAQELVRSLEQNGAEVILFPTVSFAPPEDWQKNDEQLSRLEAFDAILFLSKNAVRYIFDRCARLGIKCEMVGSPNRFIVAVGPATAQALTEKGVRVDYVGKTQTGESVVREFRESLGGRRVLLPRSDRGDERVSDALREIGATVTEVVAYRTVAPLSIDAGALAAVRAGEVDAIVFSSPSAFQNLENFLDKSETKKLAQSVAFAAIGPTTARAIREAGVPVAIEAARPSSDQIVEAMIEYFSKSARAKANQ